MAHLDTFLPSAHIGWMEPNAIKAFRKARGQSQSAFGADLDVDRKTVQRWEHGDTRPPGNLLERACRDLQRELAETIRPKGKSDMAAIAARIRPSTPAETERIKILRDGEWI